MEYTATRFRVHKTVKGPKILCGAQGNRAFTWLRVTCPDCKKKRMSHKGKAPQCGPKEFI